MITYSNDDIFNLDVEALVNPVNCVGVMGKGLALEFKVNFYDNFLAYQEECKQNRIGIGKCFVFELSNELSTFCNLKYIINFPTKITWRETSQYDYIKRGLIDLENIITNYKIKSIAIPALGCGLGQLEWEHVRQLLITHLSHFNDVNIIIIRPKKGLIL